jgi:hypothetical protein
MFCIVGSYGYKCLNRVMHDSVLTTGGLIFREAFLHVLELSSVWTRDHNCVLIQAGNQCYELQFNSYHELNGCNYWNCYFGDTRILTITDPNK